MGVVTNSVEGASSCLSKLTFLAEEYRDVLRARGRCVQHVTETHNHLTRLIAWAKVDDPGQLTESVIQRAVGNLLAKGRALRTCNSYLRSFKSFCRWMVRNRHMASDPAEAVPDYKAATDLRHERTAYSEQYFESLMLTAASSTSIYWGVTGLERAQLYHGAACTGLREGTLYLLTVGQFTFDGPIAVVRVRADQLKSGKALTVPIQQDSAAMLKRWMAEKMPTATAFRFPARKWNWSKMLKRDLREAGIPYCEETLTPGGRKRRRNVLDFHALRHTFCSRGAMAGVPLTVMQGWMGHSSPMLTAKIYNHVLPPDVLAALGRLTPLPGTKTG